MPPGRRWFAALALAAALGCVIVGPAARPDASTAPNPPAHELPPEPALLARLPLAVAEVLVSDPALSTNGPPLQASLRRTAAREGFAVTSQQPAAGDLVLKSSFDWTPLGSAGDPRLFISLTLERDGERVDEVSLQQAEGFPATEPELDALVTKLVRQLARSRRTQGYLRDLTP
jgi:hypothetical protein